MRAPSSGRGFADGARMPAAVARELGSRARPDRYRLSMWLFEQQFIEAERCSGTFAAPFDSAPADASLSIDHSETEYGGWDCFTFCHGRYGWLSTSGPRSTRGNAADDDSRGNLCGDAADNDGNASVGGSDCPGTHADCQHGAHFHPSTAADPSRDRTCNRVG